MVNKLYKCILVNCRYFDSYSIVRFLLFLGWAGLFFGGVSHYSGSWLIYTFFSVVFFVMLLSGLYRQDSYGYLFLVIMLWLGFWLKVTVHLIFPYPFTEFTGRFVSGPEAWDEVLLIAMVAAVGVLLARLLASRFRFSVLGCCEEGEQTVPPVWYQVCRTKVWLGLIFGIAVIAILNAIFGFQQSGLVPRYIIGWHLNGVVYYLLSVVFSICCATLLWWDIRLGRNVAGVVYLVLYESMVSSISLLSRGTLVFHAFPQLLALYRLRARLIGYAWQRAVLLFVALAVSVIVTYSMVNSLRNHYYSNAPLELSVDFFKTSDGSQEGGSTGFLRFAVDRWLGVEGVMTVASYPEKGAEQFWRGLTERSEDGKVTMYQEISLSHYREMDAGKFRFANLPGAVGFFYYSGSLVVVFVGLAIFTFAIFVFESWVFSASRNPLLRAFVGGCFANTVCQFGVAPSNLVPLFLALAGSIFIVKVIQSRRGEWLFR